MKYLLLTCSLFLSSICFSQKLSVQVNNQANQPLSGASVRVKPPGDSSQLMITNEKGDASWDNLSKGSHRLYITFTGFQTVDTLINLQENTKLVIRMPEVNAMLQGVTVVAGQHPVEFLVDRTVYKIEGVSVYSNKSVKDILKGIPKLQVSGNDITIKGSGAAAVMIDDRLVYLNGKDLMDYLNVFQDNISSIEVIANPPAKYDAQGAGLINIVTKKKGANGFYGFLESGVSKNTYWGNDDGVSISFRNKNLSLLASGGKSLGAYRETVNTGISYFQSPAMNWVDSARNKAQYNNDRFSLTAEWLLSARTKIYGSFSHTHSDNTTKQSHQLGYGDIMRLDSTGSTTGQGTDRSATNVAGLAITSQFGRSKNQLEGSFDYVEKSSRQSGNSRTVNYLPDQTVTGNSFDLLSYGNIPKNVISARLDLLVPEFLKKSKLEAGVKYVRYGNKSETDYDRLINGRSYFEGLTTFNKFDYRETNMAGYISLNEKFNSWNIKAGLRLENTRADGNSQGPVFSNSFTNLFPSAFVQRSYQGGSSINIAYNRRITRPSLYDVNPYRFYTTLYSYYIGNPSLRPSLQDNLNFTWNLKGTYNFSVFYNVIHQPIVSVPFQSDDLIVTQKLNDGLLKNYGVNIDAGLELFKHLSSSLSASLAGFQYTGIHQFNSSKRPLNISFAANNALEIASGFTADVNYSVTLPGAYTISRQRGYSSLDIGCNKSMADNQIVLTLSATDILKSGTQGSQTRSAAFLTETDNYYDFRQVSFSIRYKFGKEFKVVKKKGQIQEANRL